MLRPSYTDLMKVLNNNNDLDNQVTSRYTIVIAAAKRARQIIDSGESLEYANTDKAVSTAVKEMYEGKVTVRIRNDIDLLEQEYVEVEKREASFETQI